MATGNYGTIRPSDVSPEDVQIVMVYTESRDETQNFVKNLAIMAGLMALAGGQRTLALSVDGGKNAAD